MTTTNPTPSVSDNNQPPATLHTHLDTVRAAVFAQALADAAAELAALLQEDDAEFSLPILAEDLQSDPAAWAQEADLYARKLFAELAALPALSELPQDPQATSLNLNGSLGENAKHFLAQYWPYLTGGATMIAVVTLMVTFVIKMRRQDAIRAARIATDQTHIAVAGEIFQTHLDHIMEDAGLSKDSTSYADIKSKLVDEVARLALQINQAIPPGTDQWTDKVNEIKGQLVAKAKEYKPLDDRRNDLVTRLESFMQGDKTATLRNLDHLEVRSGISEADKKAIMDCYNELKRINTAGDPVAIKAKLDEIEPKVNDFTDKYIQDGQLIVRDMKEYDNRVNNIPDGKTVFPYIEDKNTGRWTDYKNVFDATGALQDSSQAIQHQLNRDREIKPQPQPQANKIVDQAAKTERQTKTKELLASQIQQQSIMLENLGQYGVNSEMQKMANNIQLESQYLANIQPGSERAGDQLLKVNLRIDENQLQLDKIIKASSTQMNENQKRANQAAKKQFLDDQDELDAEYEKKALENTDREFEPKEEMK